MRAILYTTSIQSADLFPYTISLDAVRNNVGQAANPRYTGTPSIEDFGLLGVSLCRTTEKGSNGKHREKIRRGQVTRKTSIKKNKIVVLAVK